MLTKLLDFLARSSGERRRYLTRGFGFRTPDAPRPWPAHGASSWSAASHLPGFEGPRIVGGLHDARGVPVQQPAARRAQRRATAREDGAKAARYGLSRDVNPWNADTELWRSWNAGWRCASDAD